MPDSSGSVSAKPEKASSPEPAASNKPALFWVIPAVTATVLIAIFSFYYFVYVRTQREYLANRNFRALAILGDQFQAMVSIHGSILEFCADLAHKQDVSDYLVVRPEDKYKSRDEREIEIRKDYLNYLAPGFALTEVAIDKNAKPAKRGPRVQVRRSNGRWELLLRSEKHNDSSKEYSGSLELESALKPITASLPFDDILLVSKEGAIVYQSNKAGPQFTTLTSLLQAQTKHVESKPEQSASSTSEPDAPKPSVRQNADGKWRNGSTNLTDVELAGTQYKLFLQPVLVDAFDHADTPVRTEPAQEWVICGLRSAKALEWEALSISSTIIIVSTGLLLALGLVVPVLKIFFMNKREPMRLRSFAFVGIFLVLLASVFTLSGLEFTGFPLNDDTDRQLDWVGDRLSGNIHDELGLMRQQLIAWCKSPQLRDDLLAAGPSDRASQGESKQVIRKLQFAERRPGQKTIPPPPEPTIYPYVNNAFWTDDDGQQLVKWSASGFLTPMIDISRLSSWTDPKLTYIDGSGPAFHLDSIEPPNKLEYLAALTMTTQDCNPDLLKPVSGPNAVRGDLTNGSAFLTAQPLSLIDPILPSGFGFALVDAKGSVLFHSDKTRNLHENFLQESDWNRELAAAAFGHSTGRALKVKYMGKDYKVRVMSVAGVSQAPWSLIVYRDLTSVRTLDLQAMTMASTWLLLILAGPFAGIGIWWLIRRPRFAPEFLWPNPGRMGTYRYQIFAYAFLIVLFLFLAFTGPVEQNVIACAAIPLMAFLLTAWSLREHARLAMRQGGSLLGLIAILPLSLPGRSPLRMLAFLAGVGIMGAIALPARSRRYLTGRWNLSLQSELPAERAHPAPESRSFTYRKYYALSVVLMIFLVGILTPMALFRAALNVERRLGVKQAQLHLASALGERMTSIKEQCLKHEMGETACAEFERIDGTAWSRIVLDPMFLESGRPRVVSHWSPQQPGTERYSGWFGYLIYTFHHDYNDTAAQMSAVITDRVNAGSSAEIPEWSWDNKASTMTLRWHGIHLPAPESGKMEDDLLITANAQEASWRNLFAGATVAVLVILGIACLVWNLLRKVFLFDIAPVKISGAQRAVELIREGRNVVALVPPISNWRPEMEKWTLDINELATGPRWADDFDLDTVPLNTLIEILHFEHSSNDAETHNQKFTLLDRLRQRDNTQLAVVMTVPASPEDYRRMFPDFEIVDLREAPFYWLKQYESPARDLIWGECGPMPALWPLGAQLARDIGTDEVRSAKTIASEILERADAYYRLVWKECSDDQKFVLAQLARDGLLNPTNERAIRQLVRRGLITTDPQFRLMNESFRLFLRSAGSGDLEQKWLLESRRSGWGKAHGALFTTMFVVGAFLLTTQNELWQSSAGIVTTALGALGTVTKFFNVFRGGASAAGEKAD
jgi:hypothetical protein